MGGVGLDFGHGPQHDVIRGNCIYDTSSSGICVGEFDDYGETASTKQAEGNVIQDNYITRVGREYEDGIGICSGYNRHLLVDHNDISDCPYMGISVGWGWSQMGYSFQNTISNNNVHHFMFVLHDGGGIYTLSVQGDAEHPTVWKGNYIEDGANGNALYADEGSSFMEITQNVLCKVGDRWVSLHGNHDMHVHHNYTDKTSDGRLQSETMKAGWAKKNIFVENTFLHEKPDALSDAAKAIVSTAGLEPEFAKIKGNIVKPDIENSAEFPASAKK
jgi:hypothetical protein